mmetsp:Transcript_25252/g.42212  ORF Transcript_25252/g.42212 Transcript_25252/m.42212 type:complete len:200 (+) Transcript_25252:570-1169(+)
MNGDPQGSRPLNSALAQERDGGAQVPLNRSAVAACGLETKNGESATGTGDASCDRRIPFVPAAEIPFPCLPNIHHGRHGRYDHHDRHGLACPLGPSLCGLGLGLGRDRSHAPCHGRGRVHVRVREGGPGRGRPDPNRGHGHLCRRLCRICRRLCRICRRLCRTCRHPCRRPDYFDPPHRHDHRGRRRPCHRHHHHLGMC